MCIRDRSIIHSPNIKVIADLNNDGTSEIVNYGEEYHIAYPPHHAHINYINKWFEETKDLNYGTDYHDYGKKTRYYSIEENGELIDQVDKIDISLTSSSDFINKWGDQNTNYLRNMYDSTEGDIEGDGASDYSGRSVSLSADGTRLAIGATHNDGNGSNSGHVRIYELQSNNSWSQLGSDINGEAASDSSGYSVSLSSDGSRVAIGGYNHMVKIYTDSPSGRKSSDSMFISEVFSKHVSMW